MPAKPFPPRIPRKRAVTPFTKESDYYDAVTNGYYFLHKNQRAYENWFRETQPEHAGVFRTLPKHSRAMSSLKAKMIIGVFVSRLISDVMFNATRKWVAGALPAPDQRIQPLADGKLDRKTVGDADEDADDYDYSTDDSDMVKKDQWVVDTDSLIEVEAIINSNAMMPEMKFRQLPNMLERESKQMTKPTLTLLPNMLKTAPKALLMTVGKGLWGFAIAVVENMLQDYAIDKIDELTSSKDTPKKRRRTRVRRCVFEHLNNLRQAKAEIENGYAGNRALESSDDGKRITRTYKSRR